MTAAVRQSCLTLALLAAAAVSGAQTLAPGAGQFTFVDTSGASNPDIALNVFYYRPEVVTADTPVWFSFHGNGRNAETARNNFVSAAAEQGAIVLAPEFSRDNYPTTVSYNLGNIATAEVGGTPIDRRDWSFSKIEPLFDRVVGTLVPETEVNEYFTFGHSAGAQFTHRFLQYVPDARVELAVAANAGWYTLAQYQTPDYQFDWPYTLSNTPGSAFPEEDLEGFLGDNLVVLLGDQDQSRENAVRTTVEADAQGPNRFERGQFFFNRAQAEAAGRGVDFGFNLQVVPGVDHSSTDTAIAAAELFRLANLAPGDYDQDGRVGATDYDLWRAGFGAAVTPGAGADGNGDGLVNAADFTLWRDNLQPAPTEAPPFFYVGAAGGDFFNEANWNTSPTGDGDAPAPGTINPGGGPGGGGVSLDLVIDGATVSANDLVAIGEAGAGSLTLTGGARLNVNGGEDLRIDADGALTVVNSTLDVDDNIDFRGRLVFTGSSVTAGNDIELEPFSDITSNGTSFTAADNLEFFAFSPDSSITGGTFRPADRLGLNSDSINLVLTDATIIVDGGAGDVEDVAGDLTDDAGTLTLLGNSSLLADDIDEGARLVLGDQAVADVGNNGSGAYVGIDGSTITLISTEAELTVSPLVSLAIDPRDFIINGLTGLTYAEDPTAWNLTNWNGFSAVTLRLESATAPAVPEPGAALLLVLVLAVASSERRIQRAHPVSDIVTAAPPRTRVRAS